MSDWLEEENISPDLLVSHMKDLLEECNDGIIDKYLNIDVKTGTTASVILLLYDRFYILHVGDSKVCLYSDGRFEQLTIDDTVYAVRNGEGKMFLNNYMGKKFDIEYSYYQGKVSEGDLFLWGSDGFFNRFKYFTNEILYRYNNIIDWNQHNRNTIYK